MNTPTYQQQFDKLTEAYIAHKVDPHQNCACFVGNLLGGFSSWASWRDTDFSEDGKSVKIKLCNYEAMKQVLAEKIKTFYEPCDIIELEGVFLNTYYSEGGGIYDMVDYEQLNDEISSSYTPINEDALFIAFAKTLDLLKSIHISKGEVIDSLPKFQKRQLTAV